MYQSEKDEDAGRYELLGAAMLWGTVAFVVASVGGMMATDNIWRGAAIGVVAAVFTAGFMLAWAVPGLIVIGVAALVGRLFKRG